MGKRYWNELTFSENAIEWIRGDDRITCTFSAGSRFNNGLRKLARDYPDEAEITENKDGSVFGSVPLAWLQIKRPRQMTEEEKRERAARFNGSTAQKQGDENGQKPIETPKTGKCMLEG